MSKIPPKKVFYFHQSLILACLYYDSIIKLLLWGLLFELMTFLFLFFFLSFCFRLRINVHCS